MVHLKKKVKKTKRRYEIIKVLNVNNFIFLTITLRFKKWTAHMINKVTFNFLLE